MCIYIYIYVCACIYCQDFHDCPTPKKDRNNRFCSTCTGSIANLCLAKHCGVHQTPDSQTAEVMPCEVRFQKPRTDLWTWSWKVGTGPPPSGSWFPESQHFSGQLPVFAGKSNLAWLEGSESSCIQGTSSILASQYMAELVSMPRWQTPYQNQRLWHCQVAVAEGSLQLWAVKKAFASHVKEIVELYYWSRRRSNLGAHPTSRQFEAG